MQQVMIIPYDGQEIGQGYNSETRESVGTALLVQNASDDADADGQNATFSFESVTTQESLMDSLGISASADARYGLFSGGAKFDFAQSHAVNSFSSFVAGRAFVQNAIRHGHGFTLSPDAASLVTAQRMDEFKTAFGDMFVRSKMSGGEFNVIAQITSVSEEHQTSVAAALHGEMNGLVAAGSFQAAFNTANKDSSSSVDVQVFLSQAGGQGGEIRFTGTDVTKILTMLDNFASDVLAHPVGFQIELAAYNTIPIPVPTVEETEDRQLVLQDCLNQKMKYLKAISDLDLTLGENASMFFDDLPTQDQLGSMQTAYRSTLNALMAHAILVSTGKMNPPQLFVANPPPPALSFHKKVLVNAGPPAGYVTIPAWTTLQDVQSSAHTLGLNPNIVDVPSLAVMVGSSPRVISITPAAGTSVPPGTTVTVQVAVAKHMPPPFHLGMHA